VREALTSSAWAWVLHVVTGAAAIATFVLLWMKRYLLARITAAVQVTGILWGWALAQYPYLVRPDLTVSSAAADSTILVILLWILGAGAVILIPSLVYLYRLFARPEGSTHAR
jgi:cytochrome d ubiquinol oxidase subunit II